jgi:hypothetical protein
MKNDPMDDAERFIEIFRLRPSPGGVPGHAS